MKSRREFLSHTAMGLVGASSALATTLACHGGDDVRTGGSVSLVDGASAVGRRFGTLNGNDIRKDMAGMLARWRSRGLTDGKMAERAKPFRCFVEKFAPYWMDEIESCATEAGVPVDEYVAYLAGKYRDLFFVEDCTSFLAVGEASSDGSTLFHKNRDNVARPQSAFYKKIVDSSKPAGSWGVGDTSDLGLMMMVNEFGLAGSADVGGLREDRPKGLGVMNPYILRLIAERAECCEDALEIIQETIRDGWYAGGPRSGTHWLFADRFGRGLRVAQNSHEEQHWFYEDDVVFLARGQTSAGRALRAKKGDISVRDMNEAASDPDICFSSSISGLTVRIDRETPAVLSDVWVALPAWAPYLPIHSAASAAPRELVDGRVSNAGYELLKLRASASKPKGTGFGKGVVYDAAFAEAIRSFQGELYGEAEASAALLADSYERGATGQATELALSAALKNCEALMGFLKRAIG